MKNSFSNLVFLVLVVHGININAQNPIITWSSEIKEDNGDVMSNIIFDDGNNIYVYVYSREKGKSGVTPGIMKLDASLKHVHREDYVSLSDSKANNYILGIFHCGDKFIMLTYLYSKDNNSKRVFATPIDPISLKPLQSAYEIWDISAPLNRDIDLTYKLSSDSSLFVINAEVEQKDREKRKIGFKILNSNLNVINEYVGDLDHLAESYSSLDYQLNNDGTLYHFGKLFSGKNQKETTKSETREK